MIYKDYIKNFEKLGIGLFVHFGLYSAIGKGEWVLKLNKNVDKTAYENLIKSFNINKNWAVNLVKTAKQAGCKYITITTRHHDGFSLYDTKGLSDYDIMHSPCKRDIIREFVEECNKNSIKPIFYHTLIDWHNSDYANNFSKYIDYLAESIKILCTNYGEIGGFWFDGMWDKMDEDWQEDRIYGIIRKYQKNAMIINNTGLSERGKVGHPEIDCVTFERGTPCLGVNSDGKYRAGEMCQVLNDHWGYAKCDINYKSVSEIIENLVDCRINNCNFLLNTGLMGNGSIRAIDKEILKEVGKWIKINQSFIYDAVPCDIKAENAFLMKGNDCYYAICKNVGMSADPNVAINGAQKTVKIDRPIKSGIWLDNGEKIDINGDSFAISPFDYGRSLCVRVAKIII